MQSFISILLAVVTGLGVLLIIREAYRFGARRAHRAVGDLAAINEIGLELLRAQLSLDDLCELVYQQAQEIVPTAFFQIGLFAGDSYEVKVWIIDGERHGPVTFQNGAHRGIVGWVRDHGQSLLVDDFEAERDQLPAFPEFEHDAPPRSGIFVPLIAGESTIGVVAIQSRQPRRFNDEHRRLLTALANQAAFSIRNAQTFQRAQHRAEQLNLIGQVSAEVSSVQPLPAFFHQVVTLIKDTFKYYAVSIVLSDPDGSRLRAMASTASETRQFIDALEPGQGMIGWAAANGQTALANNVEVDARYRKLDILPETCSEVALPLLVEDRVLGVLDVQSDRLDAFSAEDVSLMETLASQIALAIDQAQIYDAELKLAQRLEALVQVSQAIVSVLDLDDLLDRLVELVTEAFGFERVHIFVRIGDMLVFRAGTGPHSVRWLIDELSYKLNDAGLIPRAARTADALLVGDVRKAEDYVPGEGVEDTRSEMVIPIQMTGQVMGVLDIQSAVPDAFTDDDLVMMRSLADSVAVALRNAALYANERRRRNLADALREVSASLAAQLDLDDILAEVLEGMRRVLTLNRAAVLLIDEPPDTLTAYASTGPALEGFVGYRYPLREFDRSDEAAMEASVRQVFQELLGIESDQTLITVPLIVGGSIIGYVVADQPYAWLHSSDDFEIVSAFTNQAAIAISNGRLYAAQQAEAYVTTALLQVAEAVNAQVDTDEALETIARLTALLAGVSRCLILRWNPESRSYVVSAQYGVSRDRMRLAAASPIPADRYPLLDLLSVADRPLGAGQDYHLPVPDPLSVLLPASNILSLPLQAKRGLVGLLVVDEPRRDSNPRLMNILTGIAHQTASILETAVLQTSAAERDRLEQELQMARNIQASFIPDEPPKLPGWEIAASWQSARQVSGDFYDFIPLPGGLWGMLVADVADKGTPAALFMAVCRTLLRAVAVSRTSPAATLLRVNELLLSDARTDLFVTVFYSVWNPASGRLTYASGGHNPALILPAEGRIQEIRTRGIALGVVPIIEIEEHHCILKPGHSLIAYTDGVTEAMQEDYTEYSLERLKTAVTDCRGQGAAEMLRYVLDDIEEFVQGAPQSDDLTLWILKRTGTV